MVVDVLDRYYLGITLLITVGWQCLGFAIAWTLQVSGGLGADGRLTAFGELTRLRLRGTQFDKITE